MWSHDLLKPFNLRAGPLLFNEGLILSEVDSMSGWVKLHRKFLEWEWYDDNNVKIVFIHLLLKANHKPKKWRGETIERGQVLTGRIKLSEEIGLSERQIRTALTKLKSTNDLTIKATKAYSVITICNYDTYQSNDDIERPAERPTSGQASDQQATNERPTSDHKQECKEYKNEKNDKENKKVIAAAKAAETRVFNSEFDEMWPYLSGIPSNKNYETAKKKYACLRGNGYECEEIKRYYYEEHIKKADAPKFIKQFVLAATLGNLKAWRKFEPVEMEQPKNNAEKISDALDELFDEEITA